MTLTVHPDPEAPAGGFAFLELPGGSLPDGPAMLAVQEVYGDRWLAASGDWQTTRHDFGPYEVHRHDGADWLRIGPEIVDRIEEYTPLRIVVGGQALDVTWPDDVPPRAEAAVLGGIQAIGRRPASEPVPQRVPAPPVLLPEPEPEPEPMPEPTPDPSGTAAPEDRRPPAWQRPLLLVLALLAALLAAWWLIPAAAPPEPAAIDAPEADRCTLAALGGLPGGFAAIERAIRDCGSDVSADTALRLVEDAAGGGDAGALLLFGTLYDGDALDPRIENLIGLSFADDPAKAAEYYARAAAAGSLPAKDRLSAICNRLAGAGATLEKGAHDDFCR